MKKKYIIPKTIIRDVNLSTLLANSLGVDSDEPQNGVSGDSKSDRYLQYLG